MNLRTSLSTPVERQASLTIGTVESVSPAEIFAGIEVDAPRTTALNTGTPVAFPRLNSFVVIPNEAGALVGMVAWIGTDQSRLKSRTAADDLVDLPFPQRRMKLVPVGTLERSTDADGRICMEMRRGVVVFPSVGDPVALPSGDQLDALVLSASNSRRVRIGRALVGNDAEVYVDPDKLFGRHLAILGNTGSGKSCSVAGLIRWSLDAAQEHIDEMLSESFSEIGSDLAHGEGEVNADESSEDSPPPEPPAGDPDKEKQDSDSAQRPTKPAGRFIVLDPNGEYSRALQDLPGFRLLRAPSLELNGAEPLRVPAWLLSSQEWASVLQAGPGIQRPVLAQSLRHLRTGGTPVVNEELRLARLVASHIVMINGISLDPNQYASRGGLMRFADHLGRLTDSLERYRGLLSDDAALDAAISDIRTVAQSRVSDSGWQNSFSEEDVLRTVEALEALAESLSPPASMPVGNEDLPRQFDVSQLPQMMDAVVDVGEHHDAVRHLGGLKLRVNSLVSDERIQPILVPDNEPNLSEWLNELLGPGDEPGVIVVDLSLVPSDVIEIVVAVMARVAFEALQRHRQEFGESLPTSLVLEEAHTFVNHKSAPEEHISPSRLCTRTFERIAREGRKFGLGLILSSQRPSEISPTVLAQCNSFLLHRLVNDRDQDLVAKLVPDSLAGLLEDLPSLPARHALLLGWATALPTLLEIRELPESERPLSEDPDFWNVWTHDRTAPTDWDDVAEKWAG